MIKSSVLHAAPVRRAAAAWTPRLPLFASLDMQVIWAQSIKHDSAVQQKQFFKEFKTELKKMWVCVNVSQPTIFKLSIVVPTNHTLQV